MASANLGRIKEAKRFVARFSKAFAKVPDTRMLFNNKSQDILRIAEEMMKGEVFFKAVSKLKAWLTFESS